MPAAEGGNEGHASSLMGSTENRAWNSGNAVRELTVISILRFDVSFGGEVGESVSHSH